MPALSEDGKSIEIAGKQVPLWLVLAIVCIGQFMVVLDVSIVNVALPSIKKALKFSTIDLQWIVNAYTVTFAGFLLLGGRAADLFGRRRIFMVGLGLFTAASLLGGAAQNQAWLITARAVQGFGAAVLAPATLTIITATFAEGPSRAKALGVWSAVASAGASAGSLLGGILTDLLNWRWILLVNVPIGLAVLAVAIRFVPESKADLTHRHLDALGATTITGGLVAIVWGIVRTETYGWGSAQVYVPLIIGVALVGVFLYVQARVSKAPLVPLRIFRSRSVAGGNVVIFLLFGAMFSSWYFETLYLQQVLGYSPLKAGLAFLPQTVIIAGAAQITARMVGRVGPRPLILGGALVSAGGMFWLSRIGAHSSYETAILVPFILIGIGMGFFVTPVTVAGTAGVPRTDAGLASGLLNSSRTVGASIGLAALATLAASRTTHALGHAAATSARVAVALTDGYSEVILVAAILLLAGGIASMLLLPSLKPAPLVTQAHDPAVEPRPEPAIEGV
jgi:EmrB/QacA subfamily drug resistance transporter